MENLFVLNPNITCCAAIIEEVDNRIYKAKATINNLRMSYTDVDKIENEPVNNSLWIIEEFLDEMIILTNSLWAKTIKERTKNG